MLGKLQTPEVLLRMQLQDRYTEILRLRHIQKRIPAV